MSDYAIFNMFYGQQCIIRNRDGASIPMDPANDDYQTYLAWVAQGNTPDPPSGE